MNREIGNKLIEFAGAVAKFSKAISDHTPTLAPAATEMRLQAIALRDAINEAPAYEGEREYQAAVHEWNYGKPQAQHSPLPWHVAAEVDNDFAILSDGTDTGRATSAGAITRHDHVAIVEGEANAALIVASVNHAGKLAEALNQTIRDFVPSRDKMTASQELIFDEAMQALAAYEADRA